MFSKVLHADRVEERHQPSAGEGGERRARDASRGAESEEHDPCRRRCDGEAERRNAAQDRVGKVPPNRARRQGEK